MVMSNVRNFVLILTILGLPLQAVASTPAPLEEIVAVVNDELILKTDFTRKLSETQQALRQSNQGTLPPENILKQQVLEQLVLNAIQRQMAKELGIEVTDDMLNQALETVAKQNQMSVDSFRATLKQDGIAFSAFKEDLRQEIQISELRRQKIGRQIQVSNQEIDNFLGTKRPEGEAHYSTDTTERDKAKEAIQKRKYMEELQNWLIEIRNQAYVDIRLKTADTAPHLIQ